MTDNQKKTKAKSPPKRQKREEALGVTTKEKDPIALEIKRAREERDLNISDLSRLTGISRTVLFGYEAGRTRPGAREIRLIAEVLKVSPNRLLFGSEEPFEVRKGVSTLVTMAASNPITAVVASMFLLPMAAAVLREEEKVAFMSLLMAMVEARDKEAFKKIRALTEVFNEVVGTPEKMAAFNALQKDPVKAQALQAEMLAKMDKRMKEL